MAKRIIRTVVLRDPLRGRHVMFLPGSILPDHLESKVTNRAAFEVVEGSEEVTGETPSSSPDEDEETPLTEYTVPQLRTIADDEMVDLTGISRKEDIIEAIEGKRASYS